MDKTFLNIFMDYPNYWNIQIKEPFLKHIIKDCSVKRGR